MGEMSEIYKRHKREEVEPYMLEVRRFTVDGNPTCMAWYGVEYPRMACQFLGVSHFGTQHECVLSGERIWPEGDGRLTPTDRCPLWGGK